MNIATHCIEDMLNCGNAVTVRVYPESCTATKLSRLFGRFAKKVPLTLH